MHKKSKLSFWQTVAYGFALLTMLLIFSAYFAPDMMMSITNQVWALCGW